MRTLVQVLALFIIFEQPVLAQLPDLPYPNFVPGALISSSEVNANFSLVGDYALNGTGGTVEGSLTFDTNITIDGVDVSDFFSSGRILAGVAGDATDPAFGDGTSGFFFDTGEIAWALSGTERGSLNGSGLTIRGTNIFNSSGQIPALSSTYFASLAAQDLLLGEASFTDGTSIARLAADETITGSFTFSDSLLFWATWNNGGETFTGVDVSITSTASAAASTLWKVDVDGSTAISTTVGGKTIVDSLKITGGAGADYFLVGNGDGTGSWIPSADASPIPSGMLGFFEDTCPTGWTIRSDAGNVYEDKFVRGGATFSGSGGGTDSHTHSVDPPATTSGTESAGHTHTVNPASVLTSAAGAHGHDIAGSTGSDGGTHTHTFTTGGPSSTVDPVNFLPESPEDMPEGSHTHTGETDSANINHTHSDGSLNADAALNHQHNWDLPSTATGGVSTTHTHSLNIGSFTSGSGSNVPAYVQVIMCRKD